MREQATSHWPRDVTAARGAGGGALSREKRGGDLRASGTNPVLWRRFDAPSLDAASQGAPEGDGDSDRPWHKACTKEKAGSTSGLLQGRFGGGCRGQHMASGVSSFPSLIEVNRRGRRRAEPTTRHQRGHHARPPCAAFPGGKSGGTGGPPVLGEDALLVEKFGQLCGGGCCKCMALLGKVHMY